MKPPDIIITYDGTLSKKQLEALRDEWCRRYVRSPRKQPSHLISQTQVLRPKGEVMLKIFIGVLAALIVFSFLGCILTTCTGLALFGVAAEAG